MAKEIPEDQPVRPRGFGTHEISGHQMPIADAPGVLEAQEVFAASMEEAGPDTASAPSGFSPFDHDHDGKPGGSLPKAQRK